MIERSLKEVIYKAKESKEVVIVGIGGAGKELYQYLKLLQINVAEFFDNADKFEGRTYDGIKISKPYKREDESCLYVVAVTDISVRKSLKEQLLKHGISGQKIVIYYMVRDYDFWSNLEVQYYAEEHKQQAKDVFGWDLDVENPKTYNEKVFVDKFYGITEQKIRLADKYLVRDWVKEKIGEKYLVKQYAVWNNATEIDFDVLPNSFVLKANHGSGYNIVVKDKSKIDEEAVRKQFSEWLNEKYGFMYFEPHYNGIDPRIVCEEYLEGLADNVYDYNIYCFHGEPKYIHCIKNCKKVDAKGAYYDEQWNKQPFSHGCPIDEEMAPKPKQLDEMLKLSEILCKDFRHIRVDWYNMPDGRVLFGEMTITPWGGMVKFIPEEYDQILGKLI